MKKSIAIFMFVGMSALGSAMAQQENEAKRQDPMPNPKTTVGDADNPHAKTKETTEDTAEQGSASTREATRARRHRKWRHSKKTKSKGHKETVTPPGAAQQDQNPGV